jgi:type IV pilus assembly protein PilX
MPSLPRVRGHAELGMVLLVVMVVLLLATLMVVGAMRTAWFSERLTSLDADHERAFANAQALLADAESDIRGQSCAMTIDMGIDAGIDTRSEPPSGAQKTNCRASADEPRIPRQGGPDFLRLHRLISAQVSDDGIACTQGICLPEALPQGFWKRPAVELAPILHTGARYAQFSGAPAAPSDNPLLASQSWYWIEVLPYVGPWGTAMAPDADNPFVYRITVLAEGHRASTQVVLQRLFVWKRVDL